MKGESDHFKSRLAWVLLTALLLVSLATFAATYVMPNGTNYFANHLFSTYAGTTGAQVTTGQVSSLHTFTVTRVGATAVANSNLIGRKQSWAPGNMPTGSGYPATVPQMHEMSKDAAAGGGFIGDGIVRYTFNTALPLGTHVYMQDVDQGETATLRFYTCAGALIDPSGFDYLRVSTLYTPNATFTTNNVTLTDSTGNVNRPEPLVAIIIRDPNVCRIDYTGTFGGGTFETYFSLPPTDLSVTKSLATPNPVVAGGPVSWTITLTNTSPATGIAGLSNPAHAYGISMTDTVNSSVTDLTATITSAGGTTGGSCTVGAGNVVSCSGFSHLANGSSIVITLSGTLAANYSGTTLANSATATIAVPNDTTPGNNTGSSSTPVVRAISLGKAWVGATAGDAVSLAISGGANVTSIVAGSSTAPATTTNATALVGGSGTVVTLAETFTVGTATNYITTLACTKTSDGSAVAVSGSGLSRTLTMPADSGVSCTYTNAKLPTLRIVKSVPAGQGTAFDFSQSGMPASATGSPNAATATTFTLNPSVVAGSSLTATQTYTNVPPATAITVNELKTANINQYSLVNIACANASGTPTGSTFPTTINNSAATGSPIGTATITLVPGADVTCTFNNVRNPRIVIVKNTLGGDGTFSFTETSSAAGTSLSPASPISLTTAGGSATTNTSIAGLSGASTTNVTITEAVTAGFTLTSISCTNLTTGTALTTGTTPSATVTLASRQVVLGAVSTGSEVQCTFVNTRNAQLQLRKTWVNARVNDAVTIPATSGFATTTTALSSVANTANESDSGTAVNVLVGATGTLPTESFTTGSAGNYLTTGWVCTDGGTTVNVAQGGSLTIPASSAGTTLVCTLTNTRRQATLALAKTWVGAVVNDTASLQSSGGVNTATLASVANAAGETDTGGAVVVFAGEALTLSETLGAGNVGLYTASAWSCTGTSGLAASTVTIGGADTAIVCTITNSRQSANLSITKTNGTDTVTSGTTTSYTIVVTNNGSAAADNAIVTDNWTSLPGLNCSAGPATCAASGTAGTQCPGSVTPASLAAGVAIPVFPSGGIVTFTLTCAVTASGL